MRRSRGRSTISRLLAPLAFMLLLLHPFPARASSRLAVMDLRPQEGVTAAEARTLTGLLRTALHQTGAFTLINREDLEEIARNYQIELTLCDDDACLLRLGTLVGAQLLVTGDVGRVFDDYVVNLRLVDLVGGTLANRVIASEVTQGNALAFQSSMTRAARKLAGQTAQDVEETRGPAELPTSTRRSGSGASHWAARAGISPFTGLAGVEYRGGHVGAGAGYAFNGESGAAAGMRYYFRHGPSWFVGPAGFYTSGKDENGYRDEYWLAGLFAGRVWSLGRSWDLAASAGVAHVGRIDRHNAPPGASGSVKEADGITVPFMELAFGYRP